MKHAVRDPLKPERKQTSCSTCGEILSHSAYYRHLYDSTGAICPGKKRVVTNPQYHCYDPLRRLIMSGRWGIIHFIQSACLWNCLHCFLSIHYNQEVQRWSRICHTVQQVQYHHGVRFWATCKWLWFHVCGEWWWRCRFLQCCHQHDYGHSTGDGLYTSTVW